jgi:hypothetical protein
MVVLLENVGMGCHQPGGGLDFLEEWFALDWTVELEFVESSSDFFGWGAGWKFYRGRRESYSDHEGQ